MFRSGVLDVTVYIHNKSGSSTIKNFWLEKFKSCVCGFLPKSKSLSLLLKKSDKLHEIIF